MRSTAHIGEHPIHPMLIPYPFALLSTAAIFDVSAALTSRRALGQTARHMTVAGLGSALLAAVPGIVDYFGTVPRGSSASRTATQHALCNVSALACFATAESQRREDGQLPSNGLALVLLGTGLLGLGGWLGGQLVYHEHIGVADRSGTPTEELYDHLSGDGGLTQPTLVSPQPEVKLEIEADKADRVEARPRW